MAAIVLIVPGVSAAGEPTVSTLDPPTGIYSGDALVTIGGSNFVFSPAPGSTPTVTFGGVAATVCTAANTPNAACTAAPSMTSLQVITPAHPAGAVNVIVANNPGAFASTPKCCFTYIDAPTITTVLPNGGPAGGGTTVRIAGFGFSGLATGPTAPTVTFGAASFTAAIVNKNAQGTSMNVTTPGHPAGIVGVTVQNHPGGEFVTKSNAYTFRAAPTVSDVSPYGGNPSGGTPVTITGANFLSGATVKFGTTFANSPDVTVVSSTQITAKAPAHGVGGVAVEVANPDGQTGQWINQFKYQPGPAFAATNPVSPVAGSINGGTVVTITGTGFLPPPAPPPTVTFGGPGFPATAVQVNTGGTQILATTPAHVAATVAVTVTNDDTQTATLANNYTFRPAPTVTSVSPTGGLPSHATQVIITGAGFLMAPAAVPTVTFGGAGFAATSVVVNSPTQITAMTPSNHGAGGVDVVVTNVDDGQSGTCPAAPPPACFTFRPAPTISAAGASPNGGPSVGGNTVTISGTGFVAGATVTFGGGTPIASTSVAAEGNSLTVVAPAHAAGAVALVVTNTDTQSGSCPNPPSQTAFCYTYRAAPNPTGIAPSGGAIGGGTLVTITGTDFLPAGPGYHVLFGGIEASSVSRVSATKITAITPGHAAGTVDVVVQNPDTQSGTLVAGFTYQGGPAITGVSPISGPLGGNQLVAVTGTGFLPGAVVTFGTFGGVAGTQCTGFDAPAGHNCSHGPTATSIEVVTPAHDAGPVDVVVTNPDDQSSTLGSGYTYSSAAQTFHPYDVAGSQPAQPRDCVIQFPEYTAVRSDLLNNPQPANGPADPGPDTPGTFAYYTQARTFLLDGGDYGAHFPASAYTC